MYSFCLEHHVLLRVYRSDNCLPDLQALPGYSWLWLLDDLLLCFVELTVSVWVSTFCSTLHCVLPCAGSRRHWSPKEGNSCWNRAKQFCWHPSARFHSYRVNSWSLSTTWDSNANADSTPSWELSPVKKLCQNRFGTKASNVCSTQHLEKADTILWWLMGQPKGKVSDAVTPLKSCVISTLKSLNDLIFPQYGFSLTGMGILASPP